MHHQQSVLTVNTDPSVFADDSMKQEDDDDCTLDPRSPAEQEDSKILGLALNEPAFKGKLAILRPRNLLHVFDPPSPTHGHIGGRSPDVFWCSIPGSFTMDTNAGVGAATHRTLVHYDLVK